MNTLRSRFHAFLFNQLAKLKNPKAAEFFVQSIPLWIASCVIGLVAVLYAEILHFGESSFLYFYKMNKAWVFFLALSFSFYRI